MQVVALGWLVLELTNSPFSSAWSPRSLRCRSCCSRSTAGCWPTGFDKRRALILLQSLMLADALALALLTPTGHVTVPWVMALALALGTSAAFEVPIRQAFVVEMVGQEDLMNAIALNSLHFQPHPDPRAGARRGDHRSGGRDTLLLR